MENTISLYEKGTEYNRGGEYYGVQYPRSSNGDLYGVGDNDLDFCCMWRLWRYCGYWIMVWFKEFYEDFYFIWSIGDGRDC